MGQPPEESKPQEQQNEAAANPPQQPAPNSDTGATEASPASGEAAQAPEGASTNDAASQAGADAAAAGESGGNASVHDESGTDGASSEEDTAVIGVQGAVAPVLFAHDKFDAIPSDHTSISVFTTSPTGVKTEEHFSWRSDNGGQVRLANEKFTALQKEGYVLTLLDKGGKPGYGGSAVTWLQSKPEFHYEARKTLSPG